MAWTQPRTWVAGELVTAAIMNTHVRDQLLAIAEGTATLDHVTLDGKTTAPAVAPSGEARMYFDAGADLLKASVDGGAYRPLGGGTVWPLGGIRTSNRPAAPSTPSMGRKSSSRAMRARGPCMRWLASTAAPGSSASTT